MTCQTQLNLWHIWTSPTAGSCLHNNVSLLKLTGLVFFKFRMLFSVTVNKKSETCNRKYPLQQNSMYYQKNVCVFSKEIRQSLEQRDCGVSGGGDWNNMHTLSHIHTHTNTKQVNSPERKEMIRKSHLNRKETPAVYFCSLKIQRRWGWIQHTLHRVTLNNVLPETHGIHWLTYTN